MLKRETGNICVCHSQNSAFAYHQLFRIISFSWTEQSVKMPIVNMVYKGRINILFKVGSLKLLTQNFSPSRHHADNLGFIRTGIKILGNVCFNLNMKSSEKLHLKKFNSDLFLLSVFQLLGRIHSSNCQHLFC